MTTERLQLLKKALCASDIKYKLDCATSELSSFRIGGNAAICVFPNTVEELTLALGHVRSVGARHRIIGRGSNLLFSDKGYDGALIVSNGCNKTEICDGIVKADCGASFTRLASLARESGLSGLEFAYGIPGSVGGAIYMNAGAYGGETKDVLDSCTVYDADADVIRSFSKDMCEFSYRTSIFAKNPNLVILSASFALSSGDKTEIKEKMESFMASRKEKQPLEYHNAGSTFKRPEGYVAAKLIDDAGLKGLRVGDAQVSEKHAGFIVNLGHATSDDVLCLVEAVKDRVLGLYGVRLELEIEYVD